jgi:hypothetical protein
LNSPCLIIRKGRPSDFTVRYRECLARNWPEGQEKRGYSRQLKVKKRREAEEKLKRRAKTTERPGERRDSPREEKRRTKKGERFAICAARWLGAIKPMARVGRAAW